MLPAIARRGFSPGLGTRPTFRFLSGWASLYQTPQAQITSPPWAKITLSLDALLDVLGSSPAPLEGTTAGAGTSG